LLAKTKPNRTCRMILIFASADRRDQKANERKYRLARAPRPRSIRKERGQDALATV
jgi:hypothetical protein